VSQELSESELRQIDQAIDVSFGKTALPRQHLHAAHWALCTVGENVLRLAIQIAACKASEREFEAELGSVNTRVDRYKYQLRHALALCAQRARESQYVDDHSAIRRLHGRLSSAKTQRPSCSAGQETALVVNPFRRSAPQLALIGRSDASSVASARGH
jgi:hypothetical protein